MDDYIMFRVSSDLKKKLQQEAKDRDMSLTAYIKSIIAERDKK